MGKSKIEWTEKTWNPVSGCSHVSEGCRNCYAERIFPRIYGRKFTDVALHYERLKQPLAWKKPCMIFVNSMSDLFHEDVPDEFIDQVFGVMTISPWHTYQVLTKRPMRAQKYLSANRQNILRDLNLQAAELPGHTQHLNDFSAWQEKNEPEVIGFIEHWPLKNIWLGVSIEDQQTADERIPILLQTTAAVRWVSIEPLLGPVDLNKRELLCREWRHGLTIGTYLDWVVVGGESGPKARPMHPEWARSIRDQCQATKVPFFFKQWGEFGPESLVDDNDNRTINNACCHIAERGERLYRIGKRKAGRLLDGREWNEYPKQDRNA